MEEALTAFRNGRFVMVMDSADRENECDLVIAAKTCTAENMAFMIRHSVGIICVVTDKERLERIGLVPAVVSNTDRNGTNFYVSTDYMRNTTTGVSAADRVATIRAMCEDNPNPDEFSKPGHMFPLCANPDGVLARQGHTESAYDLCRLCNMPARVAAIAELIHDDGTMLRYKDSVEFARKHNIPLITVQDIINARNGPLRKSVPSQWTDYPVSSCTIEVEEIDGPCNVQVYRWEEGKIECVVILKGDVVGKRRVATRVHSECFTGDTLRSKRCDCGKQLVQFKKLMNSSTEACLIYVRGHEGRGIGLANKIACYDLQDTEHLDTVEANVRLGFEVDSRSFAGISGLITRLGIASIALYSNNPTKREALKDITESTHTLTSTPTAQNIGYLRTKVDKCGHATELSTFNMPLVAIKQEHTIAILSTVWNEYFLDPIVQKCSAWFDQDSVRNVRLVHQKVPGALDLISAARCMTKKKKADALIVLGMLLDGESDMYQHQCGAVMTTLADLNATQDVPIISQILMVKSENKAEEFAAHENIGDALASSAVKMLSLWQDEEYRLP